MKFFPSIREKKHVHGEGSRVPKALQHVIIASNKGNEQVKAPPKFLLLGFTTKGWMRRKPSTKRTSTTSSKTAVTLSSMKTEEFEMGCTRSSDRSKIHRTSIQIETESSHSKKKPIPLLSPQQYLDALLRSRKYSTELFTVLDSAYHNKPTPCQESSYGIYMVDVVRRNDCEALEACLKLGLHPNACNSFGESLVHLACRYGNFQALEIMIQNGCNVQVSDDYGRTPLHDICWASKPCLKSVGAVLEIDKRLLFMKDHRGATPLSYVQKENWSAFIRFFEAIKDECWPKRTDENPEVPPPLTTEKPNSRPLPDPVNALDARIATLVVSGKLKPEEAELIRNDTAETTHRDEDTGDCDSESETDWIPSHYDDIEHSEYGDHSWEP